MSRFVGADEKHSLTLTWDIDIDTNDTTTELEIPTPTRFGGEWKLQVTVEAVQHLRCRLEIDDAEPGAVGGKVIPRWTFGWLRDGVPHRFVDASHEEEDQFPSLFGNDFIRTVDVEAGDLEDARVADPSFRPKTHRLFRIEFVLNDMTTAAPLKHTLRARDVASRTTSSLSSSRPDRVRLYFPRCKAELWENASFLSGSSPYFQTLLHSSSFTENVRRGRKRARVDPTGSIEQGEAQSGSSTVHDEESKDEEDHSTIGDSDDEVDDLLRAAGRVSLEEPRDQDNLEYREIVIKEASYSTYLAVLVYLRTGFIEFGPLRSAALPGDSTSTIDRPEHIKQRVAACPDLPPPVSPKSTYRLAHLLDLPALQQLSIADIKLQLCDSNAATELFSDTSALYDEVRAVILDYVVANWSGENGVRASKGMANIIRRHQDGELSRAGLIFAELAMRV